MSKSELKRKAYQLPWALQDWSYEEKMRDYEKKLVGKIIDPPEGWRYGFPCQFVPKEGQTLRDFVKEKGYPMNEWDNFAHKHIRFWDANED